MRAKFAFLAAVMIASNLSGLPLTSRNSTTPTPYEAIGHGPRFYLDYSNFQGVEGLTYTEFYIQVGYHELQFIKYKKGFRSEYDLELSILDKDNNIVETYTNKDVVEVKIFRQTKSNQKARISMVAFTFEPGVYKVKAVMTDHETQKSSIVEEEFIADSFKEAKLSISDIQFSQKIELCHEDRAYVKNKRYIEPNAIRIFANGLADIYIYFEIYNLTHQPEKLNYNYTAYFSIFNRKSKKSENFLQVHKIPGTTAAHSLRLNVDQFSGGEYDLTIRILDEATGQTAETTKSFTVLDSPIALLDSENVF